MSDYSYPEKTEIGGWPFSIQYPSYVSDHDRVMLLLHGHLGNEKSMWILTKPLSKDYFLLAPRAPIKTGKDQYSWHEIHNKWPDIVHYGLLAEQLLSRTDQWLGEQNINNYRYDVMGFSQGAVMAYVLAILYPEKIDKVAALAGFIPEVWQDQLDSVSLADQAFYVAHGTHDDIIPIEKAQQAATWLEHKGAQITFCEADIGHKLSANCFNGLGEFFA
jgi:phospholipase/carboxylesterase